MNAVQSDILSEPAPQAGGLVAQGGVSERVYPDSVPLDNPLGVKMVGSGARCEIEKWTVKGVCSKCGYPVELQKNTCGRIECPDCYKGWARRAADRASLRTWGYLHALGDYRYRPWHIVLSIPGCTEWSKYKKLALDYGCTGGVMVIHPFRIIRSVARTIQDAASKEHVNRYDYVRKHGLWQMMEYSPHAHIVGYGYLKENVPGDDFQYRKIRVLRDRGAAERAIYYLLTHALLPSSPRGHAVRYFGVCSLSQLGVSWKGTVREPVRCQCCGSEVVYEGSNDMILTKHCIALGWFLRTCKHLKPG